MPVIRGNNNKRRKTIALGFSPFSKDFVRLTFSHTKSELGMQILIYSR